MKKLFKRADILVIVSALLLAFLLFLPSLFNNDELIAQIYVNGVIADEINLGEVEKEYSFSPKENTVISVKNGAICFSSATCKDKLCVESGWLNSKGDTAACLPEKVVITIKGTGKTDMITY